MGMVLSRVAGHLAGPLELELLKTYVLSVSLSYGCSVKMGVDRLGLCGDSESIYGLRGCPYVVNAKP